MKNIISPKLLAIGFCSLLTFTSYSFAIPEMRSGSDDEKIQINKNITDDLYSAGESINVNGEISGDAVIAGMNIVIEKDIEQDALLAGYHIEIKGNVGDDVRVAAHESFISGDVKDDVFAAGKTIELNGAKIGGSIFIAGKEVKIINIEAQEGIQIKAEKIFFDSNVSGLVNLQAREIIFGENAKINGYLSYSGEISGNVNLENIVTGSITKEERKYKHENFLEHGIYMMLGYLLSIIIFSFILLKTIPKFFTNTSKKITTRPFLSFAIGLGWFIITPLVSVLLIATVLGFPFGLFLLGTWALLFLVFPYFCSALIASFILQKLNWAGFVKTLLVLIISSVLVIIPCSLFVIAPLVVGGMMQEEWNILKLYR